MKLTLTVFLCAAMLAFADCVSWFERSGSLGDLGKVRYWMRASNDRKNSYSWNKRDSSDEGKDLMSELMKILLGNNGVERNEGFGRDWMSILMKMFEGEKNDGRYVGYENKGSGSKMDDWLTNMMQAIVGEKDSAGHGGNGWNEGNKNTGLIYPRAVDLAKWGMRLFSNVPGEISHTMKGNNYNSYDKNGNLPAALVKFAAENLFKYRWGEYGPGEKKYGIPPPMYWNLDTVGDVPYQWIGQSRPSEGSGDWLWDIFLPSSLSGDLKWRGNYDEASYDLNGLSSEEEAWTKWFANMMPRSFDGGYDWSARHSQEGHSGGKGMMQMMLEYLMKKN